MLQGWQNLISFAVFKGFKDLSLLLMILLLLPKSPMLYGRLNAVIGSLLNSSLRCCFICRVFHLDFMNLLLGGVCWLRIVTKGVLVEHSFIC